MKGKYCYVLRLFEQPISEAALHWHQFLLSKNSASKRWQPLRSCCPTCTVRRVNVYSSWRGRLSRVYSFVFIIQSSLWMYIWAPDQTRHEGIVWLCIQIYLTEAATDSTRMCSPSSRRHVPAAPPAGLLAFAGVGIVLTATTKTIDRSQAELMNQSNRISLVQTKQTNKKITEQHYLTERVLLCFFFKVFVLIFLY